MIHAQAGLPPWRRRIVHAWLGVPVLALWRVQAEPGQAGRPSRANPAGLLDLDVIEAGWKARGMDLRFRR